MTIYLEDDVGYHSDFLLLYMFACVADALACVIDFRALGVVFGPKWFCYLSCDFLLCYYDPMKLLLFKCT